MQQKTQSRMFAIIFIAWLLCMLGYLVSYVFVGSDTTIPLFGSFVGDQFGDMFAYINTVLAKSGLHNVYVLNRDVSIYPPFSFIVLRGFMQFLPDHDGYHSQYTDMLILLYSSACMLALAYLFYANSKDQKERNKLFFLVFAFSSGPFLFLLERGNLLLLTLVLSAFFLLYYRSEHVVLRELALIALAMAANLKIYPALLGLMLLHDRNWKNALRCLFYGVVLFVGPFLFMGGYEQFQMFLRNMQFAVSELQGARVVAATLLNFSNTIAIVTTFFGGTTETGFAIAKYLQIPLLLLVPVGVYLIKDGWKATLLLVLVMILLPSFNWYYSACFYLIPLLLFLNRAHTRRIDYLYLILMCGTVLPVTFINSLVSSPYRQNADFAASGYLCNICGLLLVCTFLFDLVRNGKARWDTVRQNREHPANS